MSGIGRLVNVTYWWHEMKKKKKKNLLSSMFIEYDHKNHYQVEQLG